MRSSEFWNNFGWISESRDPKQYNPQTWKPKIKYLKEIWKGSQKVGCQIKRIRKIGSQQKFIASFGTKLVGISNYWAQE